MLFDFFYVSMPLDIGCILEIFIALPFAWRYYSRWAKPWMKVTEAMQNNHRVYFILFQFEASIYHHSLQLLVFLVWFSFHLVLTTLHQPLVHWYIKQVNPDTFWQTFDSLLLLCVTSMSSMLFSGREQIVRDLWLNRIILICIVWCHFLEVSMSSVAGIKLHRSWRREISDETQLNTRSPQKLRNQLPPLTS